MTASTSTTARAFAFSAVISQYDDMVRQIVRSHVGSAEDVEDVVQEVWAKALERIAALRVPVCLQAWLARIAHTTSIDWLRRKARYRRALHTVATERIRWAGGGQDDDFPDTDPAASVLAAIDRLPETERRIVRLHYLERYSCAWIAQFEDRSYATIRWRLRRARKGLRAELSVVTVP